MSESARRRRRPGPPRAALLIALVWATIGPTARAATDGAAWSALAELRDQLRAVSPVSATFTQEFVPGGFSTGDTETGRLYLELPRCARFEYLEPQPKDFLLCGSWVYTWNPGETSGRRFLVNDGEAEGIDLLRLEVDALRTRYRAELAEAAGGHAVVRLIPNNDSGEVREAAIEIIRGSDGDESFLNAAPRLSALTYTDRSGNRTRFEISGYGRLESKSAFETPPIEWLED